MCRMQCSRASLTEVRNRKQTESGLDAMSTIVIIVIYTLYKHTNVFVPICAALVGWRRLKAVVTEFPGKREVFSREERGEEERLSQSKGSLSWMYRALQKSLLLEMIVFFIELQYMYVQYTAAQMMGKVII